ncbi:hypothetical protein VE02_10333, partial [Pseudogymnoascus sp. 03VT05]
MSRKTTQNPLDNDGQLLRMTTRQTTATGTTAGPSESPLDCIANLESEMRELKAMIATLVASQTRILSTPPAADTPVRTIEVDRDEPPVSPIRNTPGVVRLPPISITRSPSIPALPRQYTEDPSNRYKKSTFLEKITPLSDGIEHTFMQWSASIRDRLVVNEDHYPTDVSRRATPFTPTAPKLDITGRVRNAVPATSGNCFKCGKPGHFQDKCPLNATVKEIDQNDPETEEQWEEA